MSTLLVPAYVSRLVQWAAFLLSLTGQQSMILGFLHILQDCLSAKLPIVLHHVDALTVFVTLQWYYLFRSVGYRIQSEPSGVVPPMSLSDFPTTRCRVVTRVCGEQGGTTGVLDWELGEKGRERERRARTRTDTEARGEHSPATQQTRDDGETEYMNTSVCMYIYM